MKMNFGGSRSRQTILLASLRIASAAAVLIAQGPNFPPNFPRYVQKPEGGGLKVPAGFQISLYAEGLPAGSRWMAWAPNGDLFIAAYSNTITVLRDTKNKGVPDTRFTYAMGTGDRRLTVVESGGARGADPAAAVPCNADAVLLPGTTGITTPMGMAFSGGYLYVANPDSIIRYKYRNGDTKAPADAQKVADLAYGGGTPWRNIIFNRAGTKMYVSITEGSARATDCRLGTIMEFNPDGTGGRIFASGFYLPEGMGWQPETNILWTTVAEASLRDGLAPDYATSVKDGQRYNPRYTGGQPDLVNRAIVPDVLLPANSTAIGLTFYTGTQFPARYQKGLFFGMYGSSLGRGSSGYRVAFVPFRNGKPVANAIEDFVTGFLVSDGTNGPITYWGRPSFMTVTKDGSLLVTDEGEVGNNKIWKISYAAKSR